VSLTYIPQELLRVVDEGGIVGSENGYLNLVLKIQA
jgi:hypothetical protein